MNYSFLRFRIIFNQLLTLFVKIYDKYPRRPFQIYAPLSIEQNSYLVDTILKFQLGSLYPSYILYFFQIFVFFVGYFGIY